MTAALCIYAGTFMRYSLAVTPPNYLLFACHFVNAGAQSTQMYRYLNYHYWGGKEQATVQQGVDAVKKTAEKATEKAKSAVGN
jgi:hypothetical protein